MQTRSMTNEFFGGLGVASEGVLTAIFARSLLPFTGAPLIDALITGVLPSVSSHVHRAWFGVSSNEGHFGHGLLSGDAKNQWKGMGPAMLGAAVTNTFAYALGGYSLSADSASLLFIAGGMAGTFAGRYLYYAVYPKYNYPSSNQSTSEPNFIQNMSNFLRHDINGFMFAYAVNHTLKCAGYSLPNTNAQISMQWITSVLSRWGQYLTSDKPFVEQFIFFPKDVAHLPSIQLANTPGQSPKEQSKLLKAVMNGDLCISWLSWFASYAMVEYGFQLGDSEKITNARNAATFTGAFVIETMMRAGIYYSKPMAEAVVSNAKVVGNGLVAGATVVSNGLSNLAKAGMSLFPCVRTSRSGENQPINTLSVSMRNYS